MSGYMLGTMEGQGGGPLPNSKQFPCARCTRKVWLSPESQKAVIANRLEIVCLYCYPGDADAGPGMTPGQFQELMNYFKRN